MSIDLPAAVAFLATHGRVLDRRRLELLVHGGDPTAVLAALDGYRNLDGGYGWGLEPDLRSPESQPAGAMHALEVLAEVAPTTPPRAVELCDWLAAISLPDGGLPFALPSADRAGNAPLWVEPNTPVSSLQITTQVAANAHLVGRHHADVAGHGWLSRATQWCLTAIDSLDTAPHAYELLFAIRFLDAVDEVEPAAARLLDRLSQYLPADGVVAVQGGRRRGGDPTARLRAPAQRPGKAAVLRGSDRGRAAPADQRARARRWVDCRICVGFARSDARVAWICDRPRGRPPPCRGPMNPRFGRRAG